MTSPLIEHALKNVWVSPQDDQQVIFKPAKITADYITNGQFKLVWDKYPLPNKKDAFLVYQIGRLGSTFIGLLDKGEVWTTFATACNESSMIVNLYTDAGIEFPRTETWYMVTEQGNLLIAVKRNLKLNVDLNTTSLYVHFYSNSFFDLLEASVNNVQIHVAGGTMYSTDDILSLQNDYNLYLAKQGATYAFINGYYVSTIGLTNVSLGDVVEYVYDGSIYSISIKKISDLPIFLSELDSTYKYLFHYVGEEPRGINYQEDVDFYLIHKDVNGIEKGVLFHKNVSGLFRMLSHSDYSIPTTAVESLASNQANWMDIQSLYIRANIRKSGTNRPLISEANRLTELYKLPDATIVELMTGLNSVVPNWKASELEKAKYPLIMRSDRYSVTLDLVTQAYGYNAISKIIGDTPSTVLVNGQTRSAPVPLSLTYGCLAMEYSEDGLFLGHYSHVSETPTYICRNGTTGFVEFISGIPAAGPHDVYGNKYSVIDNSLEYRMYLCPIVNGVPNNVWVDVTGTNNYSIDSNLLVWNINANNYYTLVRDTSQVLVSDFSLTCQDGALKFTITHPQTRDGVTTIRPMQVMMGELLVIMNGCILTEDLDYVVKFPEVHILNKEYLLAGQTTAQNFTVVFTGFCKADLTREFVRDVGFIDHELLSNNNRYDIRDDRVLRITVGGKLKTRSHLLFAETDSGVSVPNALNGLPYLIEDIVVPVNGLATGTTYDLRQASMVIDENVSNYLTQLHPPPTFSTTNVVEDLHTLYSPFCSKIIMDLANGVLLDNRLMSHYSDLDVRDICTPYLPLLSIDPTQLPNAPDSNYVTIHPHIQSSVVVLNMYQYRFVQRVIRVFMNGSFNISGYISILN